MTPEQQAQVRQVASLIRRMRDGQHTDAVIYAALIAEGWPAAAVRAAIDSEAGHGQAEATRAARHS